MSYKKVDPATMTALNLGGTFGSMGGDPAEVGRIKLWHDVTETYPGGATLTPSEDYPVGTLFPAGMPVEVTDGTPGGVAVPDSASPTGLSKDERVMGPSGVTFTVVTKGQIYAKRLDAEVTLTAAQKAKLAGITFLNA